MRKWIINLKESVATRTAGAMQEHIIYARKWMPINMQIKNAGERARNGNGVGYFMCLNNQRDTLAVSTTDFLRRMMMYHPPAEGCIRITTRLEGPDTHPL